MAEQIRFIIAIGCVIEEIKFMTDIALEIFLYANCSHKWGPR